MRRMFQPSDRLRPWPRPDRADPLPAPEEDPAAQAGKRRRSKAAKAFDFYQYLFGPEIRAEALRWKQEYKKYANVSMNALPKMVAGRQWRDVSMVDKELYAAQAMLQNRGRDEATGKFCRQPSGEEIAEAVDSSVVTPTKTKRSKKDGMFNCLAAEISTALRMENTPVKAKQVLRRVLTNIAKHVRGTDAELGRLDVKYRKLNTVEGRKNGWQKVSDEDLIEKLAEQSQESSTMHEKLGVPVRVLQSSKRLVAKKVGVCKSTLCLRLQKCRLGFAGAKVARGRCDACYCWQTSGRKKSHHRIVRDEEDHEVD